MLMPVWLTAQIQVVTNGDVGVGTTSPTTKLDVNGGLRLRAALHDISNNTGTAGQVLSSTGSGTQWITPSGGGGSLPTGTSTQTLRFDASNTLVATSMLTNDGTGIGINAAPMSSFHRLYINGSMRAEGMGVFRGTGFAPSNLTAAAIRLWNTTAGTGDTYNLSSENDGTALFHSGNLGSIFTVSTAGDFGINYRLGIGSVTGITPNTIIGRDASGMVGTVAIGSGLSLTGGTLSSTGGGYTAGTGISIASNVITNTGDTNASDDITTASNAGGDVSGPFSNLQIVANAVGTSEIANGAVTGPKIAQNGATTGQVLEWNGTSWAPATDDGTTYTAGTGISLAGNVIANTGDTNASDDITTATNAGGDVSGPFSNLQIVADAVGSTEIAANAVNTSEIANSAVTGAKIAQAGATTGQVLEWNGTTWAPATDDSNTYTAGSGISISGNVVTNTSLNTDNQNLSLSGQSLGITSGTGVTLPVVGITAGSGISVSATAGNVTITNTGGSLPSGTSTQTLRYDASNVLVANSTLTNDGTSIGVGAAPIAGFRAYFNNAIRTDGMGVFRGTGYAPGTSAAAGVRLWNTTASTGDTYNLSSENDGTALFHSGNTGNIFTVSTAGNFAVTNRLSIGSVAGITPTTLSGRDGSGNVGTVAIGSGLSLSGGTLTASGGSYVAGTGISIVGSTISNTSLNTDNQNLSLSGQTLGITSGSGVTLPVVGITAGTNITVSQTAGNYTINSTGGGSNWTVSGGNIYRNSNVGVGSTSVTAARFNVDGVQNNGTVDIGARFNAGGPMNSGAKAVQIDGSSANTVYGIDDNVSTANTLIERIKNMGTNSTSNSMQQISVNSSSAGDPTTQFTIENGTTGVTTYTVGIDNSDADKFKIQPAAGLSSSTETGITMQTDGKVGLNELAPVVTLDVSNNTDAIGFPKGTTAQRPTTLTPLMRFNTTYNGFEVKHNSGEGGWHRLTCLTSLTFTSGTSAGTSPSITVNGDDMKGIITLNTGSSPAASSTIFTATFGSVFHLNPYVMVTPANAQAATDGVKYYVSSINTGSWILTANGTLAANTQYKFNYQVQN